MYAQLLNQNNFVWLFIKQLELYRAILLSSPLKDHTPMLIPMRIKDTRVAAATILFLFLISICSFQKITVSE